jgi:hypothetical protein
LKSIFSVDVTALEPGTAKTRSRTKMLVADPMLSSGVPWRAKA